MTKSIFLSLTFLLAFSFANAQTALQFSGQDCNGNSVDLFADLDAGKAVVLHFYMPNCGSCPPPALKMQQMANNINAQFPGMVKGYAFPFQNTTTCAYSASWVTDNNLSALYAPMDSGAAGVAHYGGFGMPTVVVLGGADHRVLFATQSFLTADTIEIRDSIVALLQGTPSAVHELPVAVTAFSVFPNPAGNNASVQLTLKDPTDLVIEVTDITGKQVAMVANEKASGVVTKQFSTANLPNGNYLVRLQANGGSATQKLTVAH